MRVGILTFHYSANYGANLQSLATYSALKKLGADPVILDYRDPAKVANIAHIIPPEQVPLHEIYMQEYMETSPRFDNEADLAQYCKDNLDVVLVGSDAVFRLGQGLNPRRLINRLIGRGQEYAGFNHDTQVPPYFLNWQRDGDLPVKASIAPSSRMTKHWYLRPVVKKTIGRSLQEFDIISTRDEWTANLVKAVTGGRKSAEVCDDPLFTLDRNFDLPPLSERYGDLSQKVLLTGKYPKDWVLAMHHALQKRGLGLVTLPNPEAQFEYDGIDGVLQLPMGASDWYQAIKNAAGYIGPRIHAIIAALATNTPFLCVDPLKTMKMAEYDAYYDLLKRVGATERFFLLSNLVELDPERGCELLFDRPEIQAACDAYAVKAADDVENLLRRVLALAEERKAASVAA
ncbi:MAG: polysaccharide pyruvyl transferase family protein [Erythrobacter sp.]|nr:polysaccharide pyruvyl transferase family protein [Erythrobacter sp.]